MSNLLLNKIEMKGWKSEQLAKEIDMPKGTFSKIVNQTSTPELQNVLKVVRHVIPDKEKEFMEDYLPTLKSPDRIIEGVEYASTNRMFPQFKHLITVMGNGGNKLKQYSEVYELVYNFQTHEYSSLEIEQAIRRLGLRKDDNQNCIIDIVSCYNHYKFQHYTMVDMILTPCYERIQNLKEGYLKNSLKTRAAELLSQVCLKVSLDTEKAISYAKDILKAQTGKSYEAFAYYMIGMANLKDDYSAAKENFSKAKKCYMELNHHSGIRVVKSKNYLLDVLWSKTKEEKDHYNEESAEDNFIIGYLNNDVEKLNKSFLIYDKKGDKYLSRMAANAMSLMGEDMSLLKDVFNINEAI